jgi:preprotein translocase subunit SecG
MTTFLLIVTLIVAVLLILIIMVQNPKGGGLSSTFGGSGAMIGGVQSTNSFLDKSTWTLAAVMVGLVLIINLTDPHRQGGAASSNIENTLDEAEMPTDKPATPSTDKPATQVPVNEKPTTPKN